MSQDTIGVRDAVAVEHLPGVPVADRLERIGLYTVERYDAPLEWYAARIARNLPLDEADAIARAIADAAWMEIPADVRAIANRMLRADKAPYDVSEFSNGGLNAGITLIWNAVIGATFTTNTGASAPAANAYYNNAQARLAIGDSSTAFAATQTWLSAATNKYAQGMDATFPSVSAQTVTLKATVAGGNANYLWNEFVSDNGNGSNSTSTTYTGSSALNRAVSNQGTKTSGQSWALTLTITAS